MDFNDTPEEAAFRKEVRGWLDANATRKADDRQSFRARNDDPELLKSAKEWQDKKATAGYARITWPVEFGGRGGSPILQVIYQQEEANFTRGDQRPGQCMFLYQSGHSRNLYDCSGEYRQLV